MAERIHRGFSLLAALVLLSSGAAISTARSAGPSLAATVNATVQVPPGLADQPFDVPRTLTIPRGFSITVYARVPNARFMVLTPDANLLVSDTQSAIYLVRHSSTGKPAVTTFLDGLTGPQGMAFHSIGRTTYLYVSSFNQVTRYPWRAGDLVAERGHVIIPNLPYAPTDAHPYKDLVFGPDGKLYVGFGSSCNACASDTTSKPVRAAIYQYNADGTGARLFASGLRNPEGLAFVPGTHSLWAAVNERDDIAYPFNDSTGQYGMVISSYVDNHPPDEFTLVEPGANYGWPFCNPNPDTASGYNTMPFDPDYQYNPLGKVASCSRMHRISKGMQAHSAPLGLTFLQGTKFSRQFSEGAVIALHGSWDRSVMTGYKVVYFPWIQDGGSGHPGAAITLVSGWLDDQALSAWDRPVDTIVDPQGNLLIAADGAGVIYQLAAG